MKEELPETRSGTTTTLRMMYADHNGKSNELHIYVTVNTEPSGKPVEVFLKAQDIREYDVSPQRNPSTQSINKGYLDAMSIALSVGLRYGATLREILGKWSGRSFEPSGIILNAPWCMRDTPSLNVRVSSPVDAIAKFILSRYGYWADVEIEG